MGVSSKSFLMYAKCIPSGECLKCPIRGRSITYGPFKSRRRGASIGINLFPIAKVCSFNCIYCFRGPTKILSVEPVDDGAGINESLLKDSLRIAYEEVMKEFRTINAIDFSGSGEPTLHPKLPELVSTVKSFIKEYGLDASVGIFTNSTTLHSNHIVKTLKNLDYVEAKLDTVIQSKFELINIPHKTLSIDRIVNNLRNFRKEFNEVLTIQTILIKYNNIINYTFEDAKALGEALTTIEPDEVHLYTTYRTPRVESVEKVSYEVMRDFSNVLERYGLKVEIYLS